MLLDDADAPEPVLRPAPAAPVAPLAPYTLSTVLQTVPYFHDTFGVVVYDPPADKFILHYSSGMRWVSGCKKLITSFKTLANSLRLTNPDRFRAGAPEFALAMSSADYPGIKWNDCLLSQRSDCLPAELSPVLQFGSNFRQSGMFPTMITMPIPQSNHLNCYHYWAMHQQICDYYLPKSVYNPKGLVFPETIGAPSWDDLIPQVVWRGTDFSYLHKMDLTLRQPNFEMDVASQIDVSGKFNQRTAATNALRQVYNELVPRWKGVVWSAEAKREAEAANKARRNNPKQGQNQPKPEREPLPWANIKFAMAMHRGQKVATSEIEYYQQFAEYGIPASGESMDLETLGLYRYHIDIGGGGGTTWSGTLEKLGLPGLLFHHVTPTKDYFHDKMKPWVHYVPVREDLSDLRQKYFWAQNHPKKAQQIAAQATALARSWGTPAGFEALFREFFAEPLRRVAAAYRPLDARDGGGDWRQVVARAAGEDLRPVMQCEGYYHHDCERLVDDVQFTRVHDAAHGA